MEAKVLEIQELGLSAAILACSKAQGTPWGALFVSDPPCHTIWLTSMRASGADGASGRRGAGRDRYQARFFDVFRKFSGRLLSADENPAVLEGQWDRDKLVLMSFPDESAFHAWADSPEYPEISRDRKAGAEGIVLLAKGFVPGG